MLQAVFPRAAYLVHYYSYHSYVNEFPFLVSSSLLVFADDIKLHHCIHSSEDCAQLQHDINILLHCMVEGMASIFNVSKCKVLHIIGNTPDPICWKLHFGSHLPGAVDNMCDLGIQMDS